MIQTRYAATIIMKRVMTADITVAKTIMAAVEIKNSYKNFHEQ